MLLIFIELRHAVCTICSNFRWEFSLHSICYEWLFPQRYWVKDLNQIWSDFCLVSASWQFYGDNHWRSEICTLQWHLWSSYFVNSAESSWLTKAKPCSEFLFFLRLFYVFSCCCVSFCIHSYYSSRACSTFSFYFRFLAVIATNRFLLSISSIQYIENPILIHRHRDDDLKLVGVRWWFFSLIDK